MRLHHTLVSTAVLLSLAQWSLGATTQAPGAPAQTPAAAAKADAQASAKSPITAKSPTDWIEYQDTTFTPVLDEVSKQLAAARSALASKDNAKAAEAMQAAARALRTQADRAAKIDRQRAAADLKAARETHAKLAALTRQLDTTATQIKAGKVPTTAALDETLNKAARADLERRWLVTDVTTWYPVVEEPQRHFTTAIEDYAKKDYKAAATEVRKAASYVRLEAARATGDVKQGLDAADTGLDQVARSLEQGTVTSEQQLDQAFAKASHALALTHRAQAAEDWARKDYRAAGYQLKAAAHGLESAAQWTGDKAKSAASTVVAGTREIGDKLASGAKWTRDEVAKGFESLGNALDQLGHDIGLNAKAAPLDHRAG